MSTTSSPSIWILPRKDAPRRLLCFPYAGGGTNIFRSWDRELGNVELSGVQLPGRELRRREPPLKNMAALVEFLLPEVSIWLDDGRPAFFFGYSMGAALAYELAVKLHQIGHTGLCGLFVAACRAPQLFTQMPKYFLLDDKAFLSALTGFGGMPEIILSEPDLLALALPALRADFEVLGTYRWQKRQILSCPVSVYGGNRDPLATPADLAPWREHTVNAFSLRLFSGGHFFINDARGQLLRTLAADLTSMDF